MISHVGVLSFSYLIKFLELYNLEENVLQDVLCIALIFLQLWRHPKNLTTFPHVEFQVIVCACEWNQLRPQIIVPFLLTV